MITCNGHAISKNEESVIVKYYNGEQLLKEEATLFRNYLKKVKEKKLVLRCHCFVLSVGNRDGVYYLRKPSNSDHSSSCLLRNKLRSERVPPSRPREPDDSEIDLMAGTADVSQPKKSAKADGSKVSNKNRISKLISALMYLFDKAGTNSRLENNTSYNVTLERLHRASEEIYLSKKLDIRLSSVLQIINKYNSSELTEALSQEPNNWPKGSTYHKIVLLTCDKIVKKNAHIELISNGIGVALLKKGCFHNNKIVLNRIGNQSVKHGPFIFAFVATLGSFQVGEEKRNYPKIEKCAFHYVSNKSEMCLLESSYERQMLWALKKHFGKSNANYQLDKPIYNIKATRPDFVLKASDDSFAIEVAGIDSEEYRTAKTHMHELMEDEVGRVLEFDATNLNNPWFEMISWVEKELPIRKVSADKL